jgi:hypothetical protein
VFTDWHKHVIVRNNTLSLQDITGVTPAGKIHESPGFPMRIEAHRFIHGAAAKKR